MLKRIKNLFHIKQKKENTVSELEQIETLYDDLNEAPILVKLGSDLTLHEDVFSNLISNLREEIKYECGFIFPATRFLEDIFLQENEFAIRINGKEVESGFLIPNETGIYDEFYELFKSAVYNTMEGLFTNSVAEKYIDTVQKTNGCLIWNLTNTLSVIELKTILLDILKSGKSLNNINTIFEQIGEKVLTQGKYRDCLIKHNPHQIAKEIVNYLG